MLEASPERAIQVAVRGGAALDTVEVLRNNQVIHRWTPPLDPAMPATKGPVKVCLELGWGPKGQEVAWQGDVAVAGGRLLAVEPRFRGQDVVAPRDEEQAGYAFSSWERTGAGVRFASRTWGNPATTTPGTQALCLEIEGEPATRLCGTLNGVLFEVALSDLLARGQAGYLGGFLTPAYRFQRAVPLSAYICAFEVVDRRPGPGRDWYTVRVRQANGQWAWSSPVWVGDAPAGI